MLKSIINSVVTNKNLSQEDAFSAMEIIMTGNATSAQIGSYLTALHIKGETVSEIAGSAAAMRSVASSIFPKVTGPLLDTAGTGGDGSNSINISTAAAFVVAGAGFSVAKHGNRSASSKCGSADVLEALGVNLEIPLNEVANCIETVGIGFMFAPKFHPAMKHAIGTRRELGIRTIFNLLGPLTNPANASHQLIGVYDKKLTSEIAESLKELGVTGAMVVNGHQNMDELTTEGINNISQLKDGVITNYQFNAQDFQLRPASKEDLLGGDPPINASIISNILAGVDRSARKDVVLLNAAAAIGSVYGDIESGLKLANESLNSGAAKNKLSSMVEFTQNIPVNL
jgi:anthranilate phosphoribosyltransferase